MNSNIKKSPKSSLSLAQSLPHNGCRNKALILQSACQQTVFESCDREELMCEMREKTVKKISNFRWLLNAEKYFTQVISWKMKYFSVIIRSENDSLKKWKLLQLLKKRKCYKDVIYLICSLHETVFICFL